MKNGRITVHDCAIAADDAYGANPACSEGGWMISDPQVWAKGFAASTFERDSRVIVAFRGTDDAEDAITDLEMLPNIGVTTSARTIDLLLSKYNVGDKEKPKWLPGALAGAVQLARVRGKITGEIARVPHEQCARALAYFDQADPRPNCVVGHSLGGALAQYVGLKRRVPAVTFNAPYIGTLQGDVPVSSMSVLHVNAEFDPASLATEAAGSLQHGSVIKVKLPPAPYTMPKKTVSAPSISPPVQAARAVWDYGTYLASLKDYLCEMATYYHSMSNLRDALSSLNWATRTELDSTFSRLRR